MSPNVYNVSYTHAAGNDGSAARGARYITRRPELTREEREEGVEPTRESEWREIESIGDREQFIEEANRRRDDKRERAEEDGKDLSKDRSPGASQYMHVVISPDNGREMTDDDFHRLAEEFTRDDSGAEHPHVGAIHRDSDHDHMHLMIARDKFSKDNLEERKERGEELVRDIERARGIEREPERDREPYRDVQRDRSEEHGRGEERDRGAELQR